MNCDVLADLPPSPRSRRQQNHDSRTKYAADTNTAKVIMTC